MGELHLFPRDVYPVGRLDKDSEGLLILTNDTSLNDRLLNPNHGHLRTYYVQVEGTVKDNDLEPIRQGLKLRIKGKIHHCEPATVSIIPEPALPERDPPIRFRKNIPTSWLRLELTEGKNRQVRKMTAAIGFPTLRLVRFSINRLTLKDLTPRGVKEMSKSDILPLLFD